MKFCLSNVKSSPVFDYSKRDSFDWSARRCCLHLNLNWEKQDSVADNKCIVAFSFQTSSACLNALVACMKSSFVMLCVCLCWFMIDLPCSFI